eukprot:scaffold2003_cov139-Cylindrotheca_fusiformis.AAC.24
MTSKEPFLPLATDDADDVAVPMYSPDGPGASNTFDPSSSTSGGVGHQGGNHLYCMVCCDCRRAVLAVNIVSIVLYLLQLIAIDVGLHYMMKQAQAEAEVNVNEEALEMEEVLVNGVILVLIGLHSCGIYGALKFKKWAVATAGTAYIFSFLGGLIALSPVNMIFAGALGYPHYFFIKEINSGIMTDYNYHNVAWCCGGK